MPLLYTHRRKHTGIPRPRGHSGFTLVEVLIVLGIMGLAAAIVVPQMLNSGTLSVQAAGRMIIADLLLAQNEAIARQAPRRVVFDVDNNRYRITDAAGHTMGVNWKAGGSGSGNYVVNLATDSRFRGVRLESVNFDGGSTIEFDPLGAPTLSAGGTVDVVGGDALRYRITVAAITGRVTIAPVTGE